MASVSSVRCAQVCPQPPSPPVRWDPVLQPAPQTSHSTEHETLGLCSLVLLETVLKEAPEQLHIHKRVWTRFLSWPLSPQRSDPHPVCLCSCARGPKPEGVFQELSQLCPEHFDSARRTPTLHSTPTPQNAPQLCTVHPDATKCTPTLHSTP